MTFCSSFFTYPCSDIITWFTRPNDGWTGLWIRLWSRAGFHTKIRFLGELLIHWLSTISLWLSTWVPVMSCTHARTHAHTHTTPHTHTHTHTRTNPVMWHVTGMASTPSCVASCTSMSSVVTRSWWLDVATRVSVQTCMTSDTITLSMSTSVTSWYGRWQRNMRRTGHRWPLPRWMC